MMVQLVLYISVIVAALGIHNVDSHLRGPHHPRSEPISSHHHYRPHRPSPDDLGQPTKLTQDTRLLQDTEHIREDLGEMMSAEKTKNMSPDELEFHYFKLHDFDNNTKLDGLEILQAINHIVHWNEQEGKEMPRDDVLLPGTVTEQEKDENDFDYFIELIDKVLEEDDLDNDGYLSYIEYVIGSRKDKRKPKNPSPN